MRAAAARREHGSRARYVAGCRCLPCRAANARYASRRAVLRLAGRDNGIVDARPVRAHLRKLSRWGVGRRTVAELARVSPTVIQQIRRGQRHHCRAETARRICGVTAAAVCGSSPVDAAATWRLLEKLIEDGYTKRQIAVWLGSQAKCPQLQLRRDRVTAANARKVRALYYNIQSGRLARP